MTMIRILHIADEPNVTIPVRIFEPVQEKLDWSCRVEIGWPEGSWSRDATGIDAIQAFELALRLVGTELYCSNLHTEGRLMWLERGFGYGFPVPATIRDLLVGEDRKLFG